MLDTGRPVEIAPAYADAISNAISKVIDRLQGWEAIHWYHDEPIWFVKKRDGNLVRRVQISAFRTKWNDRWGPAIKLIPDVYRVDKEGKQIVEHIGKATVQPDIKAIALLDEDLRPRNPQDVEKELEYQLPEACRAATELTLA